ncbi:hypothetical protein [Parasitella parasitica]|uniref:DUF3074 domain-containing protein n=1 Tax=Parasitella parasitica TaxID=35722 RepID=A0A0B7N6G1_9FUNG|nr:hypothetical protein [Parasitella parasitica]
MIRSTITQQDLQDQDKMSTIVNELFDQVADLVKESKQWSLIYRHGEITTRKNKSNSYIQRSSRHTADQVTYDQLRSLLHLNHSLNETKYIKQLTDAILLQKVNAEADLVRLSFKTPAPCSNREFVELVATREHNRSFMVVSQPAEYHSVKKGHVRGAYKAWELVNEIENEKGEKIVEWTCIQHSSAGGLIPRFISDLFAARDFHHDVKCIINYIQENK